MNMCNNSAAKQTSIIHLEYILTKFKQKIFEFILWPYHGVTAHVYFITLIYLASQLLFG